MNDNMFKWRRRLRHTSVVFSSHEPEIPCLLKWVKFVIFVDK